MTSITFVSQALPTPDAKAFARSVTGLHQATRLGLGKTMPTVQARLVTLDNLTRQTYEQFYERSAATHAALHNLALSRVAESVEALSSRTDLSASEQAEQVDELQALARSKVARSLDDIERDVKGLESGLRSIRAIEPPDLATTMQQLSCDSRFEQDRIEARQIKLDKASAGVTDITAALDLFKRYELEDIFKKALPTAEEVDMAVKAVKTRKVDKELVKAAIAKVEEHIEQFGEERKFTALEQKRAALRAEVGELKREIDQLTATRKGYDDQIETIAKLPGAWQHRDAWDAEVSKIVAIYCGFLDLGLAELSQDPETYLEIEQQFKRMENFIASLPES